MPTQKWVSPRWPVDTLSQRLPFSLAVNKLLPIQSTTESPEHQHQRFGEAAKQPEDTAYDLRPPAPSRTETCFRICARKNPLWKQSVFETALFPMNSISTRARYPAAYRFLVHRQRQFA